MSSSGDPSTLPRGTLYLWPDGILFHGSNMFNETHRHFTASVLIALESDLTVYLDEAPEPRILPGIVVAPNTPQSMDARGRRVLILQVDPETTHYGRLAHHFDRGQSASALDTHVIERIRTRISALETEEPFNATAAWEAVISELSHLGPLPREIDPRIRDVLRILKERSLEPPPAAELARHVSLSEGRLIHLFTEQMGLPIRRYTLWLRLREAFLSLAMGSSITDAAHHAGFSDSAHMSRTFRGMFGIPPSFFKEGRGHVRTEFVTRVELSEVVHPADRGRWEALRSKP